MPALRAFSRAALRAAASADSSIPCPCPESIRGSMPSYPAAPAPASVIDLSSRARRGKISVRVHWGLAFAAVASLALWLLIWACVRLFF